MPWSGNLFQQRTPPLVSFVLFASIAVSVACFVYLIYDRFIATERNTSWEHIAVITSAVASSVTALTLIVREVLNQKWENRRMNRNAARLRANDNDLFSDSSVFSG